MSVVCRDVHCLNSIVVIRLSIIVTIINVIINQEGWTMFMLWVIQLSNSRFTLCSQTDGQTVKSVKSEHKTAVFYYAICFFFSSIFHLILSGNLRKISKTKKKILSKFKNQETLKSFNDHTQALMRECTKKQADISCKDTKEEPKEILKSVICHLKWLTTIHLQTNIA